MPTFTEIKAIIIEKREIIYIGMLSVCFVIIFYLLKKSRR